MFEKIGPTFNGDGVEVAEYHYAAYTDDGKLWLVSQKGVDQPKYSYYHNTILTGGYVTSFDVNTKQWSPLVKFDAIDMDENREEIVFGSRSNLYALVYQGYEGAQYRQLLRWSDNAWKKVDLKIDQGAHFVGSGRARCAYGESPSGLHLVLTDESSKVVRLAELKIAPDGGQAEIVHSMDLPMFTPKYAAFQGGWVIAIGVSGQKALLYGGCQGCGFRWEPTNMTVVNLQTKEAKEPDAKEEAKTPPWSFSGPTVRAVLANGRWIMMAGSTQRGMTSSEKNDEVWSLDVTTAGDDGKQPTWMKETTMLPTDRPYGGTGVGDCNRSVYYVDTNGVYKATF